MQQMVPFPYTGREIFVKKNLFRQAKSSIAYKMKSSVKKKTNTEIA
jgi:hypothetical protein